MKIKILSLLMLGAVFSVNGYTEQTAEALDTLQTSINKLNNRSIELLNYHALLRYVRDNQINGGMDIYSQTLGYLTDFRGLITKADSLYGMVSERANTLYSDGQTEQIETLVVELRQDYSKLQAKRETLLSGLQVASGKLTQIPSLPSDYLGPDNIETIGAFNTHRENAGQAINSYRTSLTSTVDFIELSDLIEEVDRAIENLFLRESLKATDLRNTLNAVLSDIEGRVQIEPRIDSILDVKLAIESAGYQRYVYLAREKFALLSDKKEEFEAWLASTDYSDELKSSTLNRLTTLYNSASTYIASPSIANSADAIFFLYTDVKKQATSCRISPSFRAAFDCQILRSYDGLKAEDIYSLDSNLYPIMEAQLRKFKEGL